MLVCHCRVVADRVIRSSVAEGATTVEDVTAACGAGGRCGGCKPAIEQLLAQVQGRLADRSVRSVA